MDEGQESVELTIDDLFNEQTDEQAVEQGNKDMLLKEGTWTTVPAWRVTVLKDEKDKGPDGKPRTVVLMSGKIKLDGEKDGNINYRFSAERRNAVDFNTKVPTDKPDRSFKNYLQAHKAYKVATGRDPINTGEIAAYLRDFEHKLRITQFNGRNMVVSITATPPQAADA